MARCNRTRELEVHHRRRDAGNDAANAEVLCQKCHEATSTYGQSGANPPDFDQPTKDWALRRAKNQCECMRTGGCH